MDWNEYAELIEQARRGENILTSDEKHSLARKRRELNQVEAVMDDAIRRMNNRAYMHEWHKNNPGKNKEYQERFDQRHPGRRVEHSRNYRNRHPDRCAESTRKWKASMSIEERKEYEHQRWMRVKSDPVQHARQVEAQRRYRARKKAERLAEADNIDGGES